MSKKDKLNICFVNHGRSLEFFLSICDSLRKQGTEIVDSHIILDRNYFKMFTASKELAQIKGKMLFEWDMYSKSQGAFPTNSEIQELERFLKLPSLWQLIVADRRIMNGKRSKFTADYKPRYKYRDIRGLAVIFSSLIKQFLLDIKPDAVIIFTPATLAAVASYYICKALNINVFVLKSTKISNLVTLEDSILVENKHIQATLNKYLCDPQLISAQSKEFSAKYLDAVKKARPTYEGGLSKRSSFSIKRLILIPIKLVYGAYLSIKAFLDGKLSDPHYHNPLMVYTESEIFTPIREYLGRRTMGKKLIAQNELKNENYVFFPLNSEPEISVSVYSRYFQDQVEAIRNIAQSLPLEMKLVVKEHPRAVGWRHPSFYSRILNIPNVYFAFPETDSTVLIDNSKAIVVLSSFIGFEALLRGKPVIALGKNSFNFFPASMVRFVSSISHLSEELTSLISEYSYDENYMAKYLSAVYDASAPLDLYSKVLRKSNRISGTASVSFELKDQIDNYALYILKTITYEL